MSYCSICFILVSFLASAVPARAGPPGAADEKTPLLVAEEGHELGAVSVPSVDSPGLVKEARGSLEELVKEFRNATESLSEKAFIILFKKTSGKSDFFSLVESGK